MKYINIFIKAKYKSSFTTKKEFLDELDIILKDLNEYPIENKHQILFYNKVKNTIK